MSFSSVITRYSLFFGFISLFVVSCASNNAIFLSPGQHDAFLPDNGNGAFLQLQPFDETFLKGGNGAVGELFHGNTSQPLIVNHKLTSITLRGYIKNALRKRDVPFRYGSGWDLTLKGLEQISPEIKVVVGGRISKLAIQGRKGVAHTNYHVSLELDYSVGLPAENKIIEPQVKLDHEVIKVFHDVETMNKLLDEIIAEAANQVAAKINDIIVEHAIR